MVQDLSILGVKELLKLEAAIVTEFRARGLARTNNKPLGDIAEHVVLAARGGILEPNSTKSHDITDPLGRRIQVKALGGLEVGRSGNFSFFRSFDFDIAVFLAFAVETCDLVFAREVTGSEVEAVARYIPHVNAHRATLRQVEDLGFDVTAEMQAAYESLDGNVAGFRHGITSAGQGKM